MTRLSDLIRGQSGQETMDPDTNPTYSKEPTDFSRLPSIHSSSVAEIDWYQCASHELEGIRRAVQARRPWTIDKLVRIASGIAGCHEVSDKLVLSVLEHDGGDYLITNAVNVAIIGAKIAEALHYESTKVEQVVLAGLLHDLGMFALPDTLVYKTEALDEHELQNMQEHPQRGSALFQSVGEIYPCVGRVILQEHERWDGTGYPNRLIGNQIDEMALIVGLADVFDALMSSRPYRKGMSPHQAIRAMLVNGKTVFPYHLLRALVDQLSIYPLGTTVRLNTGETAVVCRLNRQYPLRPILQVLQQSGSSRAPASRTVDLRAEAFLHIVEVVPVG